MPSWLPQTQFKLQAVIVLYFWVLASFSSLPLLEASNVIYFQGKVVLSGGLPCFWVEGLSRQPCFHSLSTDWRSWPWTICFSQALQGHLPKEGRQRHRTIYTELFLPTQSGVPLWALRWLAPKQKGEAAVIFFSSPSIIWSLQQSNRKHTCSMCRHGCAEAWPWTPPHWLT